MVSTRNLKLNGNESGNIVLAFHFLHLEKKFVLFFEVLLSCSQHLEDEQRCLLFKMSVSFKPTQKQMSYTQDIVSLFVDIRTITFFEISFVMP